MRTNIVLDGELINKAVPYSHAKTKREVGDVALRELVASHERRRNLDMLGSDAVDPAYNFKAARAGQARPADRTPCS